MSQNTVYTQITENTDIALHINFIEYTDIVLDTMTTHNILRQVNHGEDNHSELVVYDI